MDFLEILQTIILGIVQGVTEWLPISSTGHLIILEEFIRLDVSPAFMDMFRVVIQFGSILAVLVLFWNKLFPFSFKNGFRVSVDKVIMWLKIAVAIVPAAVVGLLWEDELNELFYNPTSVAIMLILFGVLFIIVENLNKYRQPMVRSIGDITFRLALIIGVFQMIAAVFPGTSRSGATIVGALIFGVSRAVAAEFTFFLAVPVMFGASLLKITRFGFDFSGSELAILSIGMIVAFLVSLVAIKFLMSYVKKNDFKTFGWYRVVLGILVLLYFTWF